MVLDPNFIWDDEQYFEDGGGIHQYTKTGALLTESELKPFYEAALNNLYIGMGAGPYNSHFQTAVARMDRYKTALIPPNHEQVGLTFITRPRLNLNSVNLRQDDTLAIFDTLTNNRSTAFMMRCLLDTRFVEDNLELAQNSPLIDIQNPFFTPLCNCLVECSGWPDYVIETETTEGGFFSEDQTTVKGGDMLNRSGELTLTFKEISGSINMSLIYLWLYWKVCAKLGIVKAYPEHIYKNRMCYTVSIYRFVLDPSRKYITNWAKATGCFPKNAPRGTQFNFSAGESIVEATNQFSVQFIYNKIEYSPNPKPIRDFNLLMRRYVTGIDTDSYSHVVPYELQYNYLGYPYIKDLDDGSMKLEYRIQDGDITQYNNSIADISSLVQTYQTMQKERLSDIMTAQEATTEETEPQDIVDVDTSLIDPDSVLTYSV